MLLFLLKCLLVILVAAVLLGVGRTWQMEHSTNQELFSKGTVPNPLPDGLYAGSVSGHTFSWQGKKFDAAQQKGNNVFGADKRSEKYPFATSVGKGVRDKTLSVLKIDYNISGNPFWLCPILDEVVEVSPGHLLGKLQVRIIPGYPFTLAFFELQK